MKPQVYDFEGVVPVIDPSAYVHPSAVLIGDVWIGDREEYRLVVYGKDGKHKRTIQMLSLIHILTLPTTPYV